MPDAPKADNLTPHRGSVTPDDRARVLGQRGCVIWMTGLSGSGKSTIACALEAALVARGQLAYVLDGDNVRHGLSSDLGFSAEDRDENIRRIGEVAALFASAGVITVTAFISPYRASRDRAREIVGPDRFIEVFVDTPIDECRKRDPKGLYRKADAGEIRDFTGIDAPYEPPTAPEVILKTQQQNQDACVNVLLQYLQDKDFLRPLAEHTA